MKASFGSRLAAYIIDFFILTILVSVICSALPVKNNDINKEITEIANKMINNEIAPEEYYKEYKTLLYTNEKEGLVETGISLLLTFGYFIVFQYMNNGQTLGKKLLKIKVVDNETKKPTTIIRGLLRSIFIFNILSSSYSILLIKILSKNTFITGHMILTDVESIVALICIIFVLYRKDGRGLHDLVANTIVVKEEGE